MGHARHRADRRRSLPRQPRAPRRQVSEPLPDGVGTDEVLQQRCELLYEPGDERAVRGFDPQGSVAADARRLQRSEFNPARRPRPRCDQGRLRVADQQQRRPRLRRRTGGDPGRGRAGRRRVGAPLHDEHVPDARTDGTRAQPRRGSRGSRRQHVVPLPQRRGRPRRARPGLQRRPPEGPSRRRHARKRPLGHELQLLDHSLHERQHPRRARPVERPPVRPASAERL